MDLPKLFAELSDNDRAAIRQRAKLAANMSADTKLDVLSHEVALPYPAGSSPHHVKGSAFRGVFKLANRVLPGGAERIKELASDATMQQFLNQKFDSNSWYDVYPFFALQQKLARTLGLPLDAMLFIVGREQCKDDLGGPMRFVLKVVSNKTIATTLTLMGSNWWDFIKYKTRLVEPKRLEIRCEGVPFILRNTLAMTGPEYNVTALRLSGSKDARFEVGQFECAPGLITSKTLGTMTYYLCW